MLLVAGSLSSNVARAQSLSDITSRVQSVIGGQDLIITAVGDVMLGSWVVQVIEKNGVIYPFAKTLPYLQSADIAIANLEAPFTVEGEAFEKKFNFKVPPHFAQGLRDGGIDVVTLANNHTMDFGPTGLFTTMETLNKYGIQFSGAGRSKREAHHPTIVKAGGKTVAFFGYSMTFPTEFYATNDSAGTAYPEEGLIAGNISACKDSVDFVVASFHWSAEKLETPKDYQTYFAHLAIDSGADLVLGHHPHVLQGVEIYKNRLIAYSLGNFAFGSYSQYAADSIILRVALRQDGLSYARCVPINVDNSVVEFQPHVVDGTRKEAIIEKLQKLSTPLNNGKKIITAGGFIWGEWLDFYDKWLLQTSVNSFWHLQLGEVTLPFPALAEQPASPAFFNSAN